VRLTGFPAISLLQQRDRTCRLAIPTVVTGVMLVWSFLDTAGAGSMAENQFNLSIIFARRGSSPPRALLVITFPFVVRVLQPCSIE